MPFPLAPTARTPAHFYDPCCVVMARVCFLLATGALCATAWAPVTLPRTGDRVVAAARKPATEVTTSEPETSESDRRLFTAVLVVPFIVEGVISVAELVAPVERKPVLKDDDADVAARLARKLA